MTTREIITLQFGHYSNFVGAHFWNIQELGFDYTGTVKSECNHDILYREGLSSKGELTYTPRLLIADLKGSLKTFPASGGLQDQNEVESAELQHWHTIEKIEEPPPPKNEFLADLAKEHTVCEKQYNLESDVTTWTDFFYPRLHSRTINIVTQYMQGDDNERFDIYQTGTSIWKSDYGDIFSDNIRKYVEECDSMQGFQVNFDCMDGFAGLALNCVEHLADEYSKSIVAYPIIPSHFTDNNPSNPEDRDKSSLRDSIRLVNLSLAVQGLSEHASFFVPLCTGEKGWRKPGPPRLFDHINYNPEIYYHSSALLASAMDTLSLKYRDKSNTFTMSDICADMTGYGRRMGVASLGIPFTMNESEHLIDYLNTTTKPLYKPITPSTIIATDKIFQLITVRGIPESYLKAPLKEAKEQMNLPAYRCHTVKEMMELYFQASNFLSATSVTVFEKPLEIKTPYPRFFENKFNKYGFIKNFTGQEEIESCPVIAGYHNGNFLADTIEKLHREVSRIKIAKLHKFQEEGFEANDYKESLDRLAEFKDNYEDNFEL